MDRKLDTESLPLKNRFALVTGAGRRIGAAIAEQLHTDGASVGIHCRSSVDAANALVARLESERPGSAKVFQADLVNVAASAQLVAEMLAWSGALDVLVNNASTFYPTPIGSIDDQQFEDLVGTNLKAPLFLSQSAAPALSERKGCIINIVDIHARRPLKDHAVYGSSKAGLAMLTRSLAKDLAPDVRVNGISPGAILWPENGMPESTRESIIAQIPLRRSGEPGDIASCVRYLSISAPYVTGQIIAVDGGRSLGW